MKPIGISSVAAYMNIPKRADLPNVPAHAEVNVFFKAWVPVWMRKLVAKLFTYSIAWIGR